ncbi:MAG: hypothetical protein EA381_17365 [Planctomycetaceae bacterium]|jgi:hypothetical protein|nr:MAG: hypothetical protein EA381_17365 [Planctomycetaceae bacterium]
MTADRAAQDQASRWSLDRLKKSAHEILWYQPDDRRNVDPANRAENRPTPTGHATKPDNCRFADR